MEPEVDAIAPPAAPLPTGSGFELPSARQVVGRGLQLALDGNRDIRNVSLYVGLLVLAVAGPAALLVVVDLPRLFEVNWQLPQIVTPGEMTTLVTLLGPLYLVGGLALLGVVTVSIDGQLMAATMLAARAAGRPLTMRESLRRARQVFWRYGGAAFGVGILSTVISTAIGVVLGSLGHGESTGASLVGTLVATLIVAPFGYILTAIVIGDVDGVAALGRSITLARARPRLAIVVAVFAFLASTFQVFGVGAALGVVGQVLSLIDPHVAADAGLLVVIPAVAIALVAFGSLGLTVGAVTAAPQITAFLGLTHFSAGLDRARASSTEETPAGSDEPLAEAEVVSYWAEPAKPAGRTRWVTWPMVALIVLEALLALAAIGSSLSG
ncbi:MAG TPA: hypothetical protein VFP19_01590 [Candidatus Limnocylindrales bacterium]|nr:hypothetical protein [Candidatus Limnocylindrales bacterium]